MIKKMMMMMVMTMMMIIIIIIIITIIIIISTYIYNALNDALSAYRIHNNLKTIFSKYYAYKIDSPSVLTVLPMYNH